MDVEQAMMFTDGTADVRDFALWVEAANTLAAEVRRLSGAVPAGHVVTDRGERMRIVCVSHAGRASAPGKPWDGEPMQDIRVVHSAAEAARRKT